MSIYIAFCGCYTTNVLRLFFGIQFLLASVGDLYSLWSLYRIFGGEGWFKEHSSSVSNYWWSTSSLRIESMYSSILWHKSFFLFGWCFSSLLWEFWVKILRFLLRLLQNVGCYNPHLRKFDTNFKANTSLRHLPTKTVCRRTASTR
jgi:hypothetical protein